MEFNKKEVLKSIEGLEYFTEYEPVEISEIEKAEKELDTKFAQDYKACVEAFGAFSVYGHEIKGICKANRLSVVLFTKHYREELGIDPKFYVIEDPDGYPVFQDASGQVYCKEKDSMKKIASSLYEYLQQ